MIAFPYDYAFGLMLGVYTILQMLHVADVCSS